MANKVFVIVLGDVGRSPRMQYHALSLATEGKIVTIIGYEGGKPLASLLEHPNVTFQYVLQCPDFKKYVSSMLAYFLKTLWQALTLLLALIFAGLPSLILVQNPPAVPSLGVCWLYSRLTSARFIIDWHNYAYTILALSLGKEHKLVKLCQWFEFFFGSRSDDNLCVTNAMKKDLKEVHGIEATALHDCPAEQFRPLDLTEKHNFLKKLGKEFSEFAGASEGETRFTTSRENKVQLRSDRPALLISSTSWTEDEDFSILVHALNDYEMAKAQGKPLPRLLVVITGKGPLKDFYLKIMKNYTWQHVEVLTPWLLIEDYPKLLACGDLGVCLHTSSSGLDLPMKVVDMFGAGLPVAAVNFNCLDELVKHQEHGTVFDTKEELSRQLQDWFLNFPEDPTQKWRASVRENVRRKAASKWHANWVSNAQCLNS